MITEIYLDDARLDFSGVKVSSTVGDLVDAVESDLKPLRRFIMELWVDGRNEGALWKDASAINKPLKSYGELRLFTSGIDHVVLQGIYTVGEYITFICELAMNMTGALRRGSGEIDNYLGAIIESTGEMVRTMDALYKCGLAYSIDVFKENPLTYYEDILRNMSALKDARLALDNVLLADILEYELTPLLKEMEEKVFSRGDM
ncbi:MAG: hypothetical protein ACE5DW_01070 [Thermodesulfobacteriota bacterium]